MEKKRYISPVVRAKEYRLEYPVMSPIPGSGEDASPYEEDW